MAQQAGVGGLVQAAQVAVEDVSRAYTLFLDVQRSSQLMVDQADQCVAFSPRAPSCVRVLMEPRSSLQLLAIRNLSARPAWAHAKSKLTIG